MNTTSLISYLEKITNDPIAWGKQLNPDEAFRLSYRPRPKMVLSGSMSAIFSIAAFKHPKYFHACIPFGIVTIYCLSQSVHKKFVKIGAFVKQQETTKKEFDSNLKAFLKEISKKANRISELLKNKTINRIEKYTEAKNLINQAVQVYDSLNEPSSLISLENNKKLRELSQKIIHFDTKNFFDYTRTFVKTNTTVRNYPSQLYSFIKLQQTASYFLKGYESLNKGENGTNAYLAYGFSQNKLIVNPFEEKDLDPNMQTTPILEKGIDFLPKDNALSPLVFTLEPIARDPANWEKRFDPEYEMVNKLHPHWIVGGVISAIFTIAAFRYSKSVSKCAPLGFIAAVCFYKSRYSENVETAESENRIRIAKEILDFCEKALTEEISKKVDFIYNQLNLKKFPNAQPKDLYASINRAALRYNASISDKKNYTSLTQMAKKLAEQPSKHLGTLQKTAAYFVKGYESISPKNPAYTLFRCQNDILEIVKFDPIK